MEKSKLLIAAMSEQCIAQILKSENKEVELPDVLHPQHLLWMCDQIANNSENWSELKLHRWIGFIQAGMLANRMLDFEELKHMFENAKNLYGVNKADQDLSDHLDPHNSFRMDIGGEG